MHCMSSYSLVCSVQNNSLQGCFPSPVSVAEQEVDGLSRSLMAQAGATFHLHNPASISHCHLMKIQGLMWNYSGLFLCREVPVDIKSLSELALTVELVLVDRPELEWTKKADLPLNLAFRPLGMSAVGFGLWFCDIKQNLGFGLANLLKSSAICQFLVRWVTMCRPIALQPLVYRLAKWRPRGAIVF